MSTTEATRTKAPSEPLLEPDSYDSQPVERLERERVTISNRLSGLRTQIGRVTDRDRLVALERRQAELKARRETLGELIKTMRTAAPDTAALEELRAAAKPTSEATSTRTPAEAKANRKHKSLAKKALDDAGVDEIHEDTYKVLVALQAFPEGAPLATIAAAAGYEGADRPIGRLNELVKKGLATKDPGTKDYRPVREIDRA